jgi:hypothetical protein
MKVDYIEIGYCIGLGIFIGGLLGLLTGNDIILFLGIGLISGLMTAICALTIQWEWQRK